jgi:hypothetical protein
MHDLARALLHLHNLQNGTTPAGNPPVVVMKMSAQLTQSSRGAIW